MLHHLERDLGASGIHSCARTHTGTCTPITPTSRTRWHAPTHTHTNSHTHSRTPTNTLSYPKSHTYSCIQLSHFVARAVNAHNGAQCRRCGRGSKWRWVHIATILGEAVAAAVAAAAVGGIIYMAAALETNHCVLAGAQRPQLLKSCTACQCMHVWVCVCVCFMITAI